jgi:DNA polymerase II small subunit/DNA polymerase delta subunit B
MRPLSNQVVATRVKELCATGAAVDYQVYPGDHESMMITSLSDGMSWIMDRFQGQRAAGNCK